MTFYEWIRKCLHREAVQTEPDSRNIMRKIVEEMAKWIKEK